MRNLRVFRLALSLVCLALVSLALTGAAHAAVHLTRTAPSPICLGQPFQIQGSFGSAPPKANVQVRPDAPKDNRILYRWRGSAIGWHTDHLVLSMPPTPVVPGTYRLVVEGNGIFDALHHVRIANCRELPTTTKIENPTAVKKGLPPTGKALRSVPENGKMAPQQIKPLDDPNPPPPGSLTLQPTIPLKAPPQRKLPGGLTPQLKLQPPTIQTFDARAVGIRGTTNPCEEMLRRNALDDLWAPVHAMITFRTGDNVRKVVISSERIDGLVRPLWSRESTDGPLPAADRDTSTHPLNLVLPWGTRQLILTATSTDGVQAHRNVKLTVNVPLIIRSLHGLNEVIDSVHPGGPRPYAQIHYEGTLALDLASNKWAILRAFVVIRKQGTRLRTGRVQVLEATLVGNHLTTDSWLWELGTDPKPTDVEAATVQINYLTPCQHDGYANDVADVPVRLVPTASRPPGV